MFVKKPDSRANEAGNKGSILPTKGQGKAGAEFMSSVSCSRTCFLHRL